MAESLAEKVDLILAKLSKLDKLNTIERLNSLASSVSSIEESVSKLERDVCAEEATGSTLLHAPRDSANPFMLFTQIMPRHHFHNWFHSFLQNEVTVVVQIQTSTWNK